MPVAVGARQTQSDARAKPNAERNWKQSRRPRKLSAARQSAKNGDASRRSALIGNAAAGKSTSSKWMLYLRLTWYVLPPTVVYVNYIVVVHPRHVTEPVLGTQRVPKVLGSTRR